MQDDKSVPLLSWFYFGYFIADVFLVKRNFLTEELYTGVESDRFDHHIFSDLHLDNIGHSDEQIKILDYADLYKVKFWDLEVLGRSILNLYSDLLPDMIAEAAAFRYGFIHRSGVLGLSIHYNLMVNNGLQLSKVSCSKKKHCKFSVLNIYLLLLVQNSIGRMSEKFLNNGSYEFIYFRGVQERIMQWDCSSGLKFLFHKFFIRVSTVLNIENDWEYYISDWLGMEVSSNDFINYSNFALE